MGMESLQMRHRNLVAHLLDRGYMKTELRLVRTPVQYAALLLVGPRRKFCDWVTRPAMHVLTSSP